MSKSLTTDEQASLDASNAPLQSAPPKPRRAKRPRIRAADSMPEAGRAIMAFHFAKLRKLEAAAANADEEAIHDMRVAIRRVRAAFRVAGAYYKRKAIRFFRSELRTLADELGAARDLDVIINHGLAFASSQLADAPNINAWLNHLRAQRTEAQQNLLAHLGSKRLDRFKEEFEAFLTEPGAAAQPGDHAAGTPRVCDVIPSAIWTQYSAVRAYEAIVDPPLEALHALRIDFKRLRYLLEFFRGILGPSVERLIETATQAQDDLGLLHDATVASHLLRQYVAEQATLSASDLAGIAAYLTAIQSEIQMRRERFPELYRSVTDKPFRRHLARLLGQV